MSLDAQLDLTMGGLQIQVDLKLTSQELVVVLGPSGAGKTTLIRALAGLIPLRAGRVILGGQTLEDPAHRVRVPPEKRPIGTLFQDRLLFPHLSVLDNVAFGLRARGMARHEAQAEALSWLARIDLATWAAQLKPGSLVAGQAQRVALIRALATSPELLLLDEPLVALDSSARAVMRRELREHLSSFAGNRLIATREPLEAMVVADQLLIMEGGRVVQSGTPAEVTERPRSRYVAELVGTNLLRGTCDHDGCLNLHEGGSLLVTGAPPGEVFVIVHPRAVSLWRHQPEGTPRNVWRGTAAGLEWLGDRVRVRIEGKPSLVAEVTPAAVADLHLDERGEVWVSVKATEAQAYPA